jgi:hypothetical protein
MKKTQHYVGLDVNKDTIMIAVADGGREAKPKGSIRELLIKICNEIHSFQMFEACKQTFLVDS